MKILKTWGGVNSSISIYKQGADSEQLIDISDQEDDYEYEWTSEYEDDEDKEIRIQLQKVKENEKKEKEREEEAKKIEKMQKELWKKLSKKIPALQEGLLAYESNYESEIIKYEELYKELNNLVDTNELIELNDKADACLNNFSEEKRIEQEKIKNEIKNYLKRITPLIINEYNSMLLFDKVGLGNAYNELYKLYIKVSSLNIIPEEKIGRENLKLFHEFEKIPPLNLWDRHDYNLSVSQDNSNIKILIKKEDAILELLTYKLNHYQRLESSYKLLENLGIENNNSASSFSNS